MDSPLKEIEFLSRSPHRVSVLDALTDGPLDRADLRAATGASKPTLGRVLGDFEERNWVTRNGATYELTALGRFVAEGFEAHLARMETERQLRAVAQWLPTESTGFTIEMFAGATVAAADPDDPYRAVRRFDDLIEGADAMYAFGTATLKSANVATLHRNVVAGMVTEVIYPPPIVEAMLEWNPEKAREAVESGNLTVLLHDDLPCGLTIFDDRVAFTGYTHDTGMLRIVVDTDDPAALAHARETYETYRAEARPLVQSAEVTDGAATADTEG